MNNNMQPIIKKTSKIPFFRRAVLQNFPFIEKDFDALTDYELLCKVVEYLNKVIEQTNLMEDNENELVRVYNELYNYVKNYFDNLDVQEEINNKLDEMASDGTLQAIISEYLNSIAIFGYDTVDDMKSASNLIVGSYARTFGYNEIGDGGDAYYIISESITSNEYETLNNGYIANLTRVNPVENIKNYIKYCTETTINEETFIDWLPAFNRMIALGIKNIYIPAGNYKISDTLIFNYSVKIYGDGAENSYISLVSSNDVTGNAIIELYRNDASCIRDICINGIDKTVGKELEAGLYIHFADNVCIDNVTIKHIKGNGLKTTFESGTNSSYDGKYTKVHIFDCTENGLHIGSTDTFFSNCVAHNVLKHGFYFTRGNNLLVNCKAYFTGTSGDETTGDGFYLETDTENSKIAHKMRLVNCEAQECGRYGFTLINTDSCHLSNCQADTCGMYCTNITSYGFYLRDNKQLNISGSVINQGLTGWIKIPLYFNGGVCNNINLTAETLSYSGSNKFFDDLYTILNFNGSNNLYINNNECLKPSYEDSLYTYDMSGLPTGYTSEGHQNFIENLYTPNFQNQSFGVGITYDTSQGTSINNKIYKEFTFNAGERFNHVGFNFTSKVSTTNVVGYGRLRFYNSENTELKQLLLPIVAYNVNQNKSLYWNFVNGNTDIPSTTAKVRVEFFLTKRTQNIEGTGYAYYKDVKIYFYNENN